MEDYFDATQLLSSQSASIMTSTIIYSEPTPTTDPEPVATAEPEPVVMTATDPVRVYDF